MIPLELMKGLAGVFDQNSSIQIKCNEEFIGSIIISVRNRPVIYLHRNGEWTVTPYGEHLVENIIATAPSDVIPEYIIRACYDNVMEPKLAKTCEECDHRAKCSQMEEETF